MKKNLSKNDVLLFIKKYYAQIICTVMMFLIFFIVFRIVPMMYDGWISKFTYSNDRGIIHYIYETFDSLYMYLNGRISSNIICGILESFVSEIPLDFFNAFTLTSIYVYINFMIKNKSAKKFNIGFLLYIAIILFISSAMRKEVLFYANTLYTFPFLLILLYYSLYERVRKQSKIDLKSIVFMSIIGFILGTWIEHMAVGFAIVISIMWFISFLKKEKYRWYLLIPTVVTILSIPIMFLAPGLHNLRTVVAETSLISTFKNCFSSFYVDIISFNVHIFILLFAFLIILEIKQYKNGNKKSIFLIIVDSIILLFALLYIVPQILPIPIKLQILKTIFPTTIEKVSFQIIFLISLLLFVTMLISFQKLKNKKIVNYLLFICLFSLAPMCFTPNSGARISFMGFLTFAIIVIILYFDIMINSKKLIKFMNTFFIILFIVSIDKTILMGRRIQLVTKKRNMIIQSVLLEQYMDKWNYDDYVILPYYNDTDILKSGIVPMNTFHYSSFLNAYDLDARTKVIFSNTPITGIATYDEKNLKIDVISKTVGIEKFMYVVNCLSVGTGEWEEQKTEWLDNSSYNFENIDSPSFSVTVYGKIGENIIDGTVVLIN